MVPTIRSRSFSLHAGVLHREQIGKDTFLVHRHTEQLASIASTSTQFLTCLLHALVLAHHLEFLLAALLGPEHLPCAMDGPVAQVTVTGEAERARSERVVKEVTDESYGNGRVNLICLWCIWLGFVEGKGSKPEASVRSSGKVEHTNAFVNLGSVLISLRQGT